MARRSISWVAALRDIKDDRAVRHPVREERLRSPSLAGFPMSCWRGVSARRYVVSIQPVAVDSFDGQWDAVVIAVSRDDQGNARIVDAACNVGIGRALDWVCETRRAGANEMHIYRLAETVKERVDMVRDLTAEVA